MFTRIGKCLTRLLSTLLLALPIPFRLFHGTNSNVEREFITFLLKNQTYQFTCLPFGLACAPWVFTKTLKPVVTMLRQLGVRLIVYIDSILILTESRELAQDHAISLVYLSENLAFVVSKPKCTLEPTATFEFLFHSAVLSQ